MKMAERRFPRISAKRGDPKGYTRWFRVDRFLAGCCDCGLVHEFRFKVVNGKPAFKLRRANGYTRQLRKKYPYAHPR